VKGAMLSVLALSATVLGVSLGGIRGWGDPAVLACLLAALLLWPTFARLQARTTAPLVDLQLFHRAGANAGLRRRVRYGGAPDPPLSCCSRCTCRRPAARAPAPLVCTSYPWPWACSSPLRWPVGSTAPCPPARCPAPVYCWPPVACSPWPQC